MFQTFSNALQCIRLWYAWKYSRYILGIFHKYMLWLFWCVRILFKNICLGNIQSSLRCQKIIYWAISTKSMFLGFEYFDSGLILWIFWCAEGNVGSFEGCWLLLCTTICTRLAPLYQDPWPGRTENIQSLLLIPPLSASAASCSPSSPLPTLSTPSKPSPPSPSSGRSDNSILRIPNHVIDILSHHPYEHNLFFSNLTHGGDTFDVWWGKLKLVQTSLVSFPIHPDIQNFNKFLINWVFLQPVAARTLQIN